MFTNIIDNPRTSIEQTVDALFPKLGELGFEKGGDLTNQVTIVLDFSIIDGVLEGAKQVIF